MLFTKESDYALRICRNLTLDTTTSIRGIAVLENISIPNAHKVARKLEKGGIIESVRGQSGGYKLVKSLDELTLLDVYKVMEPDLAINECLKDDYICVNNVDGQCGVHKELQRIQDILFKELSSKSLSDVAAGK